MGLAQQIWHDALVRQAVSNNTWMQTKTPPRTVVRTKDRALTEPQLIEVRRIVAEWCAPASDGVARLGPRRGKHLMLVIDLMAVTGLRIGEVLAPPRMRCDAEPRRWQRDSQRDRHHHLGRHWRQASGRPEDR